MTRLSYFAALAALAVFALSSNANARTDRAHAAIAGAHNSVSDDVSVRQQCYEQARARWSSSNQEMQTNRDYAYRSCAFDHGLRP